MMLTVELAAALPPGASLTELPDGFALSLGANGTLVVRDRQRPLRSARVVIDQLLAAQALPPAGATATLERVQTTEGELGAVALVGAGHEARWIGLTFGDDDYRSVIASPGTNLASAAALGDLARRILVELPSGRAHARRRWYEYTPPAGWGCIRRHHLITEWLAPNFPRERALLTIFPARPVNESAAGELDRRLHEMRWGGYVLDSMEGPTAHKSSVLGGVKWRLVGRFGADAPQATDVVLLVDQAFSYMLRFDHDGLDAAPRASLLDAVIDSIRPIPRST